MLFGFLWFFLMAFWFFCGKAFKKVWCMVLSLILFHFCNVVLVVSLQCFVVIDFVSCLFCIFRICVWVLFSFVMYFWFVFIIFVGCLELRILRPGFSLQCLIKNNKEFASDRSGCSLLLFPYGFLLKTLRKLLPIAQDPPSSFFLTFPY